MAITEGFCSQTACACSAAATPGEEFPPDLRGIHCVPTKTISNHAFLMCSNQDSVENRHRRLRAGFLNTVQILLPLPPSVHGLALGRTSTSSTSMASKVQTDISDISVHKILPEVLNPCRPLVSKSQRQCWRSRLERISKTKSCPSRKSPS